MSGVIAMMTMQELVEQIADEHTPELLECIATREIAIFDHTGFWTKPWHSDVETLISEEESRNPEWIFLLVVMANGDVQKAKLRPAMLTKGGSA